ncbi:Indole-3-glycerol-phosphate synthase [Hydrogenobacter thermophilus TK-6]|uniref:Indole-3-glycerol phosphate synthase n=1 Tax=Hydrogenobacter thermophilus (strain DSM 6534 / IAM 12695 / TK-6) TaxID=608538 RepID=D3DFH4_HYDTT|nr:indole-3-glycerol phosphate synthase TrpC [Hydrogenobacter thermophilus]ADO44520.1 Indole-3-glycerol-phosphate synthase [Hydrogenobacter thermophilus TK-6]BAI68576.1 indole-3-glycerol phosphate synthase [Hydrogenobacter thermophilus TK-6]
MGFLKEILERKRQEVKKTRELIKNLPLTPKRERSLAFEDALCGKGTKIIAEVKKASPSEGKIREVSAWHQAKIYESAGAVAVSVLTDSTYFDGSLEDLYQVRRTVNIPILRKDFIIDTVQIEEARAFGADAVLLIVRILEPSLLKDLIEYSYALSITPLVEVFDLKEAEIALRAGAKVIGINNRDLDTLKVDTELSKRLTPLLKQMGAKYVIAESGISEREQILELESLGADAFLVGTALMKSQDPAKKLRELLGYNDV